MLAAIAIVIFILLAPRLAGLFAFWFVYKTMFIAGLLAIFGILWLASYVLGLAGGIMPYVVLLFPLSVVGYWIYLTYFVHAKPRYVYKDNTWQLKK